MAPSNSKFSNQTGRPLSENIKTLLSRTNQLRYRSNSKRTTSERRGYGIGSRKVRKAVNKLDETLEKANRAIEELQGAGKVLGENVALSSALALPALALASVYQAALMEMIGTKESDPIPGIHYVKFDEVKHHALALLNKQVDSAGSERGGLHRCLTNAIHVLEEGTFINLSRLLYLLITAYSVGQVQKRRYAQYERFMPKVRQAVRDYETQRQENESTIEQVESLRKKIKAFLNNDAHLFRYLRETVEAGNKGTEQLENILRNIDNYSKGIKSR